MSAAQVAVAAPVAFLIGTGLGVALAGRWSIVDRRRFRITRRNGNGAQPPRGKPQDGPDERSG